MEILNIIKERYSVRSYDKRPVEQEKLDLILQAAKHAPTGKNFQPQKIYILESKEALKKMDSVCPCVFGAPLAMLVCYDEPRAWRSPFVEGYNCGEMDATIVCDEMMLTAWSLGIGSCWVKYFDPKKVIEVFGLPENIKPACLLTLGYPAENSKPLEKMHNSFRPMEEIVEYL